MNIFLTVCVCVGVCVCESLKVWVCQSVFSPLGNFFPYMVRRQPDGPEATCDGPEATLMVRRQQHICSVLTDGPEATCDGPEATLMVRRQQHFCPVLPDGPEAT